MWQRKYETTTDIPANKLFSAIIDINGWNKWDSELEFTKLEGIPEKGTCFILKPKGGPKIKMTIEEILSPSRLVDVAHLPLAKIRTIHEYLQSENQTTIRFTIQVFGLLGFFWRKVVGEKQIKEAGSQIASFINYVRANA